MKDGKRLKSNPEPLSHDRGFFYFIRINSCGKISGVINNRFVLIDAFALLYRAYYGIPANLTYHNKPIHAVYGFTSALLSAIKTLEPQYLAVGWDRGPSHRIKDFKEYKIHRKPTPDDLIAQLPIALEVLEALNIPTFWKEGFEGEDIIATIVANVKAQSSNVKSMEFIIVTGDMDLLQLVDGNIKIYSMARGERQAVIYDRAKVIERYGLTPEQFVDFKALKGDPSDNIPGVPGIGEKGASKLVQEFGTIEKLYDKVKSQKSKVKSASQNAKISEKIQSLLLENEELAKLSYKLSKIRQDVPLEFNLNDAKIHEFDLQKAILFFKELGFRSLIPRLPESDGNIEDRQQGNTEAQNKIETQKKENQQKLF